MILQELGLYLQQNGHGTLGTDLFIGQVPNTPATMIALLQTGGEPPGRTHDTKGGVAYEHPTLAVWSRDTTPAAALTTAYSVRNTLEEIRNVSLNGSRYVAVEAMQEPFILRLDGSENVIAAFNIRATKART
jgi:hypothetical protein